MKVPPHLLSRFASPIFCPRLSTSIEDFFLRPIFTYSAYTEREISLIYFSVFFFSFYFVISREEKLLPREVFGTDPRRENTIDSWRQSTESENFLFLLIFYFLFFSYREFRGISSKNKKKNPVAKLFANKYPNKYLRENRVGDPLTLVLERDTPPRSTSVGGDRPPFHKSRLRSRTDTRFAFLSIRRWTAVRRLSPPPPPSREMRSLSSRSCLGPAEGSAVGVARANPSRGSIGVVAGAMRTRRGSVVIGDPARIFSTHSWPMMRRRLRGDLVVLLVIILAEAQCAMMKIVREDHSSEYRLISAATIPSSRSLLSFLCAVKDLEEDLAEDARVSLSC